MSDVTLEETSDGNFLITHSKQSQFATPIIIKDEAVANAVAKGLLQMFSAGQTEAQRGIKAALGL